MKIPANPAQALHDVLSRADDQSLVPKGKPQPIARDVWLETFGIDGADDSAPARLTTHLARTFALPQQVRLRLELLPNYEPAYVLRQVSRIETMFLESPLSVRWREYNTAIDEACLIALDAASQAIASASPHVVFERQRPSVESDVLDAVHRESVLLRKAVEASSIPPPLRHYILLRLDDLIGAASLADIDGLELAGRETARVVGELTLNESLRGQLEKQSLGKRFLALVGGAALTVGLVNGINDLDRKTIQSLPWNESPAVEITDTAPSEPPKALPANTDGPAG